MVGIEGVNRVISRLKVWVTGKLDVHSALPSVHHTKYTDAEVDAIVATHTAISDAHHAKYTDAEVDAIVATHTAISGAHHAKYTDAEAAAAVAAVDIYLKNSGDVCTGKLTISTDNKTDPGSGAFHLVEENDATRFRATTFSNSNWHSPLFVFTRARGTATVPLYPHSGDTLMEILAGGWVEDLNTWRYGAVIQMSASDNWGAGSYCPTHIKFKTYVNNIQYTRLTILADGKVGINTDNPSCLFDVDSNIIRLRTAKTPATAGAAGNIGDICWDGSYVYVCVAANTWKRTAIATW